METEKIVTNKKAEILEKQKKYLFPNHLLYYTDPLPLERGEGMYVWDVEGKKYYDFLSAYSAVNQGHCHPRLQKAMTDQLQKVTLTSRAFFNSQIGPLASAVIA